MSQNPLHYVHEELLPHLVYLMDADKDYAADRIRTTFAEHPWIAREIGEQVRQAWRERFSKEPA